MEYHLDRGCRYHLDRGSKNRYELDRGCRYHLDRGITHHFTHIKSGTIIEVWQNTIQK